MNLLTKTSIKIAKIHKSHSSELVWYIFILPSMLGIVFFMLYPIVDSLYLSFTDSNGMIAHWVGFKNYEILFTNFNFWRTVYNTFYIAFFQLLLSIPIGFIIACMINSLNYGKNLFKVLYFLPYITTLVATTMIFRVLFNPDSGMINFILQHLGLPTSAWLASPDSAKLVVIFLAVWQHLGFIIIICLANLQVISPDLYEASKIDGASTFQQWLYITIPNMRSAFVFLFITGWISGLQRFTDVFILGGATGSPGGSIQSIVEYIYEQGFQGFSYGLASAATYLLFIMILIFTYFNVRYTRLKL
jgi:multiple sugar transport system permease protein